MIKIDESTVRMAKGFHVNDNVHTPNGPGVVQGHMLEDGNVLVMVAHKPKDYQGGPVDEKKRMWVLLNYSPGEVTK